MTWMRGCPLHIKLSRLDQLMYWSLVGITCLGGGVGNPFGCLECKSGLRCFSESWRSQNYWPMNRDRGAVKITDQWIQMEAQPCSECWMWTLHWPCWNLFAYGQGLQRSCWGMVQFNLPNLLHKVFSLPLREWLDWNFLGKEITKFKKAWPERMAMICWWQ